MNSLKRARNVPPAKQNNLVREGGAANFRGAPDIFIAVGSLLKSFLYGFLPLRKKLRLAI